MFPYVGAVTAIPRLGIPPLNLNDGPQGFRGQNTCGHWDHCVNQQGTSTAFPSGLTIAATWDVAAARLWGETMGEEFRDKGSNVQLGPGLCVSRLPQNGRNFECKCHLKASLADCDRRARMPVSIDDHRRPPSLHAHLDDARHQSQHVHRSI